MLHNVKDHTFSIYLFMLIQSDLFLNGDGLHHHAKLLVAYQPSFPFSLPVGLTISSMPLRSPKPLLCSAKIAEKLWRGSSSNSEQAVGFLRQAVQFQKMGLHLIEGKSDDRTGTVDDCT